MKVCVITPSYPSFEGDRQSIFVYRFTKALSDNNLDVTVVCPYYKSSKSKDELFGKLRIKRFSYFIRPIQSFTEVDSIPEVIKTFYGKLQFPFFIFGFLIKAILEGRKSDIIHAQWIVPSGFIGLVVKKLFKKPLISTTRGADISISLSKPILKKMLKLIIQSCDFITSNNSVHPIFLEQLGANLKNVKYIPNGLDYDFFKSRDKKLARKKLGIPMNSRVILLLGHLIERKRPKDVVMAMPKIISKFNNTILFISGRGPQEKEINELVIKLNLNKNVILETNTPWKNIPLLYNASDVLVLASESEGRPNVVLEGLASKTPVITTNVGDVTTFMKDGVNGFIIKPGDPNVISEKVLKLLSDEKLAKIFSEKGYEAVKKTNPSWVESGKIYKEIYESVLEEK